MSNLLRWDPLRELNNLRDNMNRILEEGLASVSGASVALDMFETEETVIVETSPLPGVNPEDIEVSITGNVLTIKGEMKESAEKAGVASYLRKERKFGSFNRSISIPRAIKAEEAVASFKNGMLTIVIPKAEETRPKVINIETTQE